LLQRLLDLRNKALSKIPEEEFMANLAGLSSFVTELKITRKSLVDELRHIDAALSVLGKMRSGTSYAKPGRKMSAAGRKRIAAAQRARWAKVQGHAAAPKPKHTISAAGKKRIAAAARARWARIRAAKSAA
jgi:hypothetical protein